MEKLYSMLSDAVVEMDDMRSADIAKKIIESNLSPVDAIELGLVDGMRRAGELFEQEEYFITELLMCADALEAAMAIIKPHIKKDEQVSKGRIVIGSIEGDTHDIGKSIVALLISSAGYDVLDLGRDVSPRKFVDSSVEFNADIIAISTLMTTTMEHMGDVIQLLADENRRDMFKVIVGGRPVSPKFASKIGADGYSTNAQGALRLVEKIMASKHET